MIRLCILVCICALASASMMRVDPYYQVSSDRGRAINCGDKQHNFSLEWTPKQVQSGDEITLYLDMVAGDDFTQGRIEIKIWVAGIKEPIISQTLEGKCTDITQYVPFDCPIKKGMKIKKEGIPIPLPQQLPVPPNDYTLEAKIFNSAQKEFLCVQVKVKFVGDNVYDDYSKFAKHIKK